MQLRQPRLPVGSDPSCGFLAAFVAGPVRRSGAAWLSLVLLVLSIYGSSAAIPEVPLVVTQVPRGVLAPGLSDPRHPLVAEPAFSSSRIVLIAPDGSQQLLTPGFHAARDPDVSFDGRRLLFSGKRLASDPWRIWELQLDGAAAPRAITPPNLPARSPIYVSTLFTLDSPEPWLTTVFVGQHPTPTESGHPLTSSLYNIKLDGTELRRLTDNPSHSLDPFQTWDGRVLYATERHAQEPATRPSQLALHAMHIEGADMEYYGGRQGSRIQRMPCATETGLVVFIESDDLHPDGSGQLARISQSRPTVTYQSLTHPGLHQYLYPTPLHQDTILVAQRPADSSAPFSIVSFDVDSRTTRALVATPEFHNLQAKPVRPRPSPDGHSTVVELGHSTGTFYGMNCYTTDEQRQDHLQPGDIKRVRFIEGVPSASAAHPDHSRQWPMTLRRLIGEAPVEPDGSFNVVVPADVPILIQTLDDKGLALGTCGWIWLKPKETRGCVGCHEDPELTPENDFVLALRRPSNQLVLAPEQRRALSFRHDIAPLFQQHCAAADCHGGLESPLRLPLNGPDVTESDLRSAYAAVLTPAHPAPPVAPPSSGKYLDPGRARTSWLVWQVLGTHTGRPWDHDPRPRPPIQKMPPPGSGTTLTPAEIATLIQWIDLGAQFDPPTAIAPANPVPTVRR